MKITFKEGWIVKGENGELIKEHPELKVDQKVIVWNDENCKVKRHFANWLEDGRIQTFCDGRSSYTSNSSMFDTWKYYSID